MQRRARAPARSVSEVRGALGAREYKFGRGGLQLGARGHTAFFGRRKRSGGYSTSTLSLAPRLALLPGLLPHLILHCAIATPARASCSPVTPLPSASSICVHGLHIDRSQA
jgi:hypothetical protein